MASPNSSYSNHVPAADRTLRLLELLAGSRDGASTAELLAHVGGSRSALYALLNTLRGRGYVRSDGGVHAVGPALWSLAPTRPVALEALVDHFRIETLDHGLAETAALVWPDGEGTVVVSEAQSSQTVRVSYDVGSQRAPSGVDARVLAAGESGGGEEIEKIRREGYAMATLGDAFEIAAPVCQDGVRPIAALLVGMPLSRAEPAARDRAVTWLREAAAHLSHRIGANAYRPYGVAAATTVGPSSEMSRSELDEFMKGLWSAQLGCVRSDGTPHVVPLWYEWDGAEVWLAGSPGASWREHIAVEPHVSLAVDEPWPPLRRVFIAGVAAEVEEGEVTGGLVGLRSRLANRYLGRGADSQPGLVDTEGWVVVRITPDRMHGRRGLGMTHATP